MPFHKPLLLIASSFGFLAVALGAFGAHALADRLSPERMETWVTATRYHLVHTVVILFLSYIAHTHSRFTLPAYLFSAGTFIFSFSLYLLCLTDKSFLGAITPIGGLLLLAGWGVLFFLGVKS